MDCPTLSYAKAKICEKWAEEIEENMVFNLRGSCKRNRKMTRLSRIESCVFMRFRIGHTRLTHSNFFEKNVKPHCDCGEFLDVDHILNCCKGEKNKKTHKIQPPRSFTRGFD